MNAPVPSCRESPRMQLERRAVVPRALLVGAPVAAVLATLVVSSLLVGRDELGTGGAALLRLVGGSGGVGATTLACGLAQRGHRQGLQVALVELDPCGGGVDLVFGAEQAKGWRWPDLASATGHIGDLRGQLPNVSGVDLVSTGRSRSSRPS